MRRTACIKQGVLIDDCLFLLTLGIHLSSISIYHERNFYVKRKWAEGENYGTGLGN